MNHNVFYFPLLLTLSLLKLRGIRPMRVCLTRRVFNTLSLPMSSGNSPMSVFVMSRCRKRWNRVRKSGICLTGFMEMSKYISVSHNSSNSSGISMMLLFDTTSEASLGQQGVSPTSVTRLQLTRDKLTMLGKSWKKAGTWLARLKLYKDRFSTHGRYSCTCSATMLTSNTFLPSSVCVKHLSVFSEDRSTSPTVIVTAGTCSRLFTNSLVAFARTICKQSGVRQIMK